MKKVIERIVESPGAPNENDLWLNGKTLKKFQNGEWVAISGGGSGSASSLSDMTDVDISSPSGGDTLVYNATTHKWESGSGSGCSCLPPMIVEGAIDWNFLVFTPGEDAPTFAEALNQMLQGGLLYLMCYNDDKPGVFLVNSANPEEINVYLGDKVLVWTAYQTIKVNGALSSDFHSFTPNNNEMSWADAKQAFDNGDHIILHDTNRGLSVVVSYYDSEENVLVTEEHNGQPYYWYGPNQDPVLS